MNEEQFSAEEYRNVYKRKGNKRLFIAVIIVILIYVFFFTSKLTLSPPISSAIDTTKIGDEIEFDASRTCRVIEAIYSSEDKSMEIVLNFKNLIQDGINDYYYVAEILNGNPNKMNIREVYNEDLFTVLRIENVPKRYKELTLYFAPKKVEQSKVTDDMTGSVTLNKRNVITGNINFNKTKKEYLKERFDSIIADYKTDLQKAQGRYDNYDKKIKAIDENKVAFEKNKPFMTDKEVNERQEEIENNEIEREELLEEMEVTEKKIEGLKEEIDSVEAKKNDL